MVSVVDLFGLSRGQRACCSLLNKKQVTLLPGVVRLGAH